MALASDPKVLLSEARRGDRRALARAISVVEDGLPGADEIVADVFPAGGLAHVIGVTGAPGAGKSMLVDRLIAHGRSAGGPVGVVAVDPSSPFTGGSILGDRIRMQNHVSDPGVFIRSMSSRGHLGGMAASSAKVVALLDALGFDPVILETVGVGQSEVEVMDAADTVVVVVAPAMGDAIQAAKAGLLEVADVLVVNKSDLPGAHDTVRDLTQMLEMGPAAEWAPPVVACSASTGENVEAVWGAVCDHRRHLRDSGEGERRRRRQAEMQVRRSVTAAIVAEIDDHLEAGLLDEVAARRLDPWAAASRILGSVRRG